MGVRILSAVPLLTPTELLARLRQIGEKRYHHRHPFHLMMHEGKLTRGQLQAWALNRYYYQSVIPIKDSIILSRADDPDFRRAWRKRVVDHDGERAGEGGIETLAASWRKPPGSTRPRPCGARNSARLPATPWMRF